MKEQQSTGEFQDFSLPPSRHMPAQEKVRTCIHALLHVFNERSITRLRHLSLFFKKGQKATSEIF